MDKNLSKEYFEDVIKFTNKYIGDKYFSKEDLEKIVSKSNLNNRSCSYLHYKQNKLVAVRISYMPTTWTKNPDVVIHPELWGVPENKVGYFKSLFVEPTFQGSGLGQRLSNMSKKALLDAGAEAIVTHSWKESPNNSSFLYLTKMGFEIVKEIPNAWSHIDYDCVRCSPKKCDCTAIEMIWRIK